MIFHPPLHAVDNLAWMELHSRKLAETILYELWYGIADTLFERVCIVTQLDQERRDVLRQIMMRPNDFQVRMQGISAPVEEDPQDEHD